MAKLSRDILYAGVLGTAIGDALGVPVEFMERETLKKNPVTDMIGYGTGNVPAGTWSDDTSMMLAIVDGLNKAGYNFDGGTVNKSHKACEIIACNFVDWFVSGEFAVDHNRFDCGNTCGRAIHKMLQGYNIDDCGVTDEDAQGNGSLMRIFPAVFCEDDCTLRISRMTHNNDMCDSATMMFKHIMLEIINSADKRMSKQDIITKALDSVSEKYMINLFGEHSAEIAKIPEEEIGSSGYVVDTLKASIWCFVTTDSYSECVLKAVNLGKDTDTTAAVAGCLAAVYYGVNSIPEKWINMLNDIDLIERLCYNKK